MCSAPALFAVQAASQIGQASAQNRAIQASMNSAVVDANRKQEDLIRRQNQEQMAAEAKIDEISNRVDSAVSTAALSSIESGAGGGTLMDAVADYTRQGLKSESSVRRQFAYGGQEKVFQARDITRMTKNRLDQLYSQRTTSGQLALGLAGSAIGSHVMGLQAGMYAPRTGLWGLGTV